MQLCLEEIYPKYNAIEKIKIKMLSAIWQGNCPLHNQILYGRICTQVYFDDEYSNYAYTLPLIFDVEILASALLMAVIQSEIADCMLELVCC